MSVSVAENGIFLLRMSYGLMRSFKDERMKSSLGCRGPTGVRVGIGEEVGEGEGRMAGFRWR